MISQMRHDSFAKEGHHKIHPEPTVFPLFDEEARPSLNPQPSDCPIKTFIVNFNFPAFLSQIGASATPDVSHLNISHFLSCVFVMRVACKDPLFLNITEVFIQVKN